MTLRQRVAPDCPPEAGGSPDIADRLAAAWESTRTQTRGMQPAEAESLIGDILKACSPLPSQWLPRLTIRRVADG
jgi:hypothetical protein